MGYGVSFNLYNAANFGAAQIRERLVIIAKRGGGRVPWLMPTNADAPEWGMSPWATLRDALQDVNQAGGLHYVQFPERRLIYFKMLGEGEYWKNLPRDVQESAMGRAYSLPGGKTGFYRRLRWDRPSPTLVTSPTMPATDLCHPTEDRPLSVEEYAAIQGFPLSWRFCGSLADVYRQIGNAVPTALGEAIGRLVIQELSGEGAPQPPEGFPFSRYKKTSDLTWVG